MLNTTFSNPTAIAFSIIGLMIVGLSSWSSQLTENDNRYARATAPVESAEHLDFTDEEAHLVLVSVDEIGDASFCEEDEDCSSNFCHLGRCFDDGVDTTYVEGVNQHLDFTDEEAHLVLVSVDDSTLAQAD